MWETEGVKYLARYMLIGGFGFRSYDIEKREQNSIAGKLLDDYKYLYTEVEVEVKLLAACDTVSSIYKRKTVSTINCAGPATITFLV